MEDGYHQKDFNLAKVFIINPNSIFSSTWKLLHIICCVISSYIYAHIAGSGDDGGNSSTGFTFIC